MRNKSQEIYSSSSSSWSSLLCMFAAAAIALSPSSTSSPAFWVVRGQSTEQHQQQETAQLRAAATSIDNTMVRGGRGRGGRAFVRQQQQHHHDLFVEGDGHDGVDNVIKEDRLNEEKEKRNESNVENSSREDEENNHSNKKANERELSDFLLSKQKNRREGNLMESQHQQYDNFLMWCQDSLGIDVGLIEIDHFDYHNYLRAMEDRIDIFCDDCNDDDDDDDWDGNDYNTNESDSDNKSGSDAYSQNRPGSGRRMISLYDEVRYLSVTEEYSPVSVRGLKASRDIEVGEIVLSIPHEALWTVHNAIDASGDPNLVESMGPAARRRHGWESPGMDEIPLLAVTVLYHMDKDAASTADAPPGIDNESSRDPHDHGPYLEILKQQTNKLEDTIPHLWSSRKLRKSATPAIRKVATAIRKDVVELYESIVMVLIENHPSVFGNHHNIAEHPSATATDGDPGNTDGDEEASSQREWMFSLEKFHWAFALVSSRHWHLNIPDDPTIPFSDVDDPVAEPQPPPASSPDVEVESDSGSFDAAEDDGYFDENHDSSADQETPPAATPTDEWVVIHDQKLIEEEEREMDRNDETDVENDIQEGPSEVSHPNTNRIKDEKANEDEDRQDEENYWPEDRQDEKANEDEDRQPPGNSFLAPLADLLNFGPPCTRGLYNHVTMAFEIVATCEFREGQEITFWYTDACEDVFMANYGFTMPMMVQKCEDDGIGSGNTNRESGGGDSSAAWQQRQQERQQQYLEDELHLAYQELDRLDRRLEFMLNVLDDCHCGNQTELFEAIWNDEDPRNHHDDNDDDDNNDDNNNNNNNNNNEDRPAEGVQEVNPASTSIGGVTAGATATMSPFPRSPTPPKKEGSSQSGGDAMHAIRNGGNRGGSFKGNAAGNGDSDGSNPGRDQQQPPPHDRGGTTTTARREPTHAGTRAEETSFEHDARPTDAGMPSQRVDVDTVPVSPGFLSHVAPNSEFASQPIPASTLIS
eukprot:CAMPEP_0197196666 /NCGR_PEP_ID=MMETSP1423-20130617/32475_1 /TAXON_ID=476441 /ORGANISM="Pseudo-nitzschia heimii, Strain UNC1101" /LENGTH=981 /DNA_ID=CAMNT_0042650477 /DNA_START=270 /DNA_END=3217 /DNA_ORIENTATION=-